MNLNDWLGDNLWSAWLVLALLLGSAEMLTLDLTLLMLAGGALAGALTALVLPGMLVVQILVAISVSVAMLMLLRPTLLNKVRDAPGYRSSIGKLVGSQGVALAPITDRDGEVKVNGEVWTARTLDSSMSAQPGEQVEVYEVDGTTLVVYPMERELPWLRSTKE